MDAGFTTTSCESASWRDRAGVNNRALGYYERRGLLAELPCSQVAVAITRPRPLLCWSSSGVPKNSGSPWMRSRVRRDDVTDLGVGAVGWIESVTAADEAFELRLERGELTLPGPDVFPLGHQQGVDV